MCSCSHRTKIDENIIVVNGETFTATRESVPSGAAEQAEQLKAEK